MLRTGDESEEHDISHGHGGHPMDIVERCFYLTGITCLLVLIGTGVLTIIF
jgi:hypothetical protein